MMTTSYCSAMPPTLSPHGQSPRGAQACLFTVFVRALVLALDLVLELFAGVVNALFDVLDLLVGRRAVAVLVRTCCEASDGEGGGEAGGGDACGGSAHG